MRAVALTNGTMSVGLDGSGRLTELCIACHGCRNSAGGLAPTLRFDFAGFS